MEMLAVLLELEGMRILLLLKPRLWHKSVTETRNWVLFARRNKLTSWKKKQDRTTAVFWCFSGCVWAVLVFGAEVVIYTGQPLSEKVLGEKNKTICPWLKNKAGFIGACSMEFVGQETQHRTHRQNKKKQCSQQVLKCHSITPQAIASFSLDEWVEGKGGRRQCTYLLWKLKKKITRKELLSS